MIQLLAKRFQKPVALLMFVLFYFDFSFANINLFAICNNNYDIVIDNSSEEFTKNLGDYDFNSGLNQYLEDNTSAIASSGNSDSAYASGDETYVDDINGPSQPEMQAFQSVNNSNMVDLFTGDFSYNIPLMDVGGYPLNLSYKSGISMDQEASWVGLGWNINPGTVTRNMRGLPDDFNGANDSITKTTSIKENKTIGITGGADIEIVGFPITQSHLDSASISAGASLGVFHNTYRGWGLEGGLNASIQAGVGTRGSLTGGLSITDNSQEGLTIAPSLSVSLDMLDAHDKGGLTGSFSTGLAYNTRSGLKSLDFSTGVRGYAIDKSNQQCIKPDNPEETRKIKPLGVATGFNSNLAESISFATLSYTPSITLPFTSTQFSFTAKLGSTNWALHPSFFLNGYVSSQKILPEDQVSKLPAYGYLNYTEGSKNLSALLDFNREKEIPYHENPPVPNIAIPSYTYDIFSITGEGTGGMFRAYRSDIGYVYDHYIKTKNQSDRFSADVGLGNLVHVGLDLNFNSTYTQNSAWQDENTMKDIVAFRSPDSTFESVYFRNPGEKSINSKSFYDAIGGDDVVTVGLYQGSTSSPYITTTNYLNRYKNKVFSGTSLLQSSNAIKKERDKRTEVISYLTAEEASEVGLSKYIENYSMNHWGLRNCNKEFPSNSSLDTFKVTDTVSIEKRINSFRKSNHISEIDVLNPDGRRYIYGIPVYNLKQKEISFSANADSGNINSGLVAYKAGTDDATTNANGIDNYYTCEETPAYAHSFLLSAILSADYVDLTGDGVSDDDLGDAIKFNYSKLAGINNPYKWRAPYLDGVATYNEGLRTDNRDDRSSYVYGEKEIWYLNSIESRTMIATFTLEDRKDALPINQSGQKDITNNSQNGTKRLKEINLYSKADFLQRGDSATPIKTVHFAYSYALCRGVNKTKSNSGYDTGKLTLTKIWITFNGNSQKGNPTTYRFFYNSNNPSYDSKSYDRWGNYKNPMQNPGSKTGDTITNSEYPYALQDSALTAANAPAWTLDSIALPSGGKIKVAYESDDYAYVQNKRAMQMFKIIGLSNSPTGTRSLNLYNNVTTDNLFVFISSSQALTGKQDIFYKYLEGVNKLYFKLHVLMPSDKYGSGYEYVPTYADIDSSYAGGGYDTVNSHLFWIKLKGISLAGDQDGNYSPLVKAAIQFLRLNLPSKAYPGSDVGDDVSLGDAVKMVFALAGNVINAFTSFDMTARNNAWATYLDTSRTFIKLDNPDYKRYGGGLRVKSIKIYDNWNTMSGQQQSVYGQQYDYTTTKEINGVVTKISSGVASYEPMIGSEENPFHIPIRYVEKEAPLAPVTLGYVEEPLGETFFPSADVGYSQVRVRSINTQNRKSANGYEETKFYTTYDFPTIVDNSMLDNNTKKRYKPALHNFLKIDAKNFLSLSQGFKVELNDMNGKTKSEATYPETDSVNAISYTQYFYKVDDQNAEFKHLSNTVSVVDEKGNIDTTAVIGKDVELMMDMREQQTIVDGNNYSPNVDVFIVGLFPVVLPTLWYLPQHEEDLYRSVATTKIIQRYGILDSIVNLDKGSIVSTKDILYDSETGDVLLTRTNDEFNDPVYNFSYPAHWAYTGMGPAYKNIDAVFSGITINNGIPQASSRYPKFKSYFESGDEILATGRIKTGEYTPFDCAGMQTTCAVNTYSSAYTTQKIWAINAQKIDSANTESIVFVDQDGNAYSATDISMKIVRSGKRNMSAATIGAITCLQNPIQTVSGALKLVLDSTANVLASSAAVFNDFWRIDDTKKAGSLSYTCACAPLKSLFDYLISSHRLFIQSSDNITVDSIARAAGVDVHSCDLLETNASGLFYALTSDTLGTEYRAQVGANTVTIKADDIRDIHFYGLSSKACGTGSTVYFHDNYTTVPAYTYEVHVYAHHGFNTAYRDSVGSITPLNVYNSSNSEIILYRCAEQFFSIPSTDGYAYNTSTVCYTYTGDTSIYLQIDHCTDCPNAYCYDPIVDTSVNPYAYGIYGNWRTQKSYVYYGQRMESDPSSMTNIRQNGTIKSFVPFWSFDNKGLEPSTDSSRWVWNAESTLFNKKGYELENKDPLGRYNSGQYGYNQTLPISVTQNSKYRDQFFDGFEDYLFKNQNCSVLCPTSRSLDFTTAGGTLDTNYRHSGRYSLKLNPGDSDVINIPITPYIKDTVSQKLISDIEVSYIYDTIVNFNGDGLHAQYDGNSNPVNYAGSIQVDVSGSYIIKSTMYTTQYMHPVDNGYELSVDGNVASRHDGGGDLSDTLYLIAGQIYSIHVSAHSSAYFNSSLDLEWKRNYPCTTSFISIGSKYLYDDSSADGTVVYDTSNCSKLIGISADSSSLIKSFSPTQGGKFWLSAWVKEDQNCLCDSFTHNQIRIVFTDSSNGTSTLIAKPTGNVIEGWQRYDYVVSVPANAVRMSLQLRDTGGSYHAYFDDIRMHPFNANMKSFVYDPITLRLMAELDENNYATFYEYDDDGTLIRVKKETQRGVQTIQETRSYLIKNSGQ